MQVISGVAKGIKLSVPKGNDVRPTSSRTRTALFSSIGNFADLVVVDLFAGSGSLGLEAASRGCSVVVFVEQSKKHCDYINMNIDKVKKAGVTTEFHVIHGDVTRSLGSLKRLVDRVDLTFADPPYPVSDLMFEAVTADNKFTKFGSNQLIWEVPCRCENETAFLKPKLWRVSKIRKFGRTEFRFYKIKNG